jgi:apurinic endonuclease APN1
MMISRCDFESRNKLVGGHVSIAESIELAPGRADSFGFNTFQIFVKSNLQWKHREVKEGEINNFRENVNKFHMKKPVAHATYLLNLGSDNKDLVQKSMDDLEYEIGLCNKMGVERLVLHPGSNRNRDQAVKSIMSLLNSLETGHVNLLIENSSGKGSTVPATLEEMSAMIDLSGNKIGLCLDTCHLFAGGYNIKDGYEETMDDIRSKGLVKHIEALHLNDSMFDIGSRKDRHENIGRGYIGKKGFSSIIKDRTFDNLPMIMETPGGDEDYIENLETLRNLMVVP